MSKQKIVTCASTGTRMTEETAYEVDAILKSLPKDCGYRTKALAVDAYNFEPGERAEISIITTNSLDKSNEIVRPEGVDMDAYRKVGPVLWNHDPDRIVGHCDWIKLHKNSIRAKTVYPPDGTELSQNAWIMVKSTPPLLKAKSIGFVPKKPLREVTAEEVSEHPEWAGGTIWDEVLMLEYSCVPVGCNNDSLVEMVNTKSLKGSVLEEMGFVLPAPQEIVEAEALIEEAVKVVQKSHMSLGQAIQWVATNCKKPVVKKPNVDKIISKVLNGLDIDVSRIVEEVYDRKRNRGRV